MKRRTIETLFVVTVLGLAALYAFRIPLKDEISIWLKPALPSASPYISPSPTSSTETVVSSGTSVIPTPSLSAINLAVPFVSQAPNKIWDEEHEEFCEEAVSLMAASYIHNDKSVTNPDIAEAALQKIKTYELSTFGYYKDTTARETARIISDFYAIPAVQVVNDPTLTQIRSWLAKGRIVIVPSAGQQLGNPNFKSPGPLYHMVLLKGYTADGQFIANDPGTRNGADYIYDPAVIMNAMHDWNGGDVVNGAKVVIVVG